MAWVKKYNRLGFEFEYINHNNDFYYKRFESIKDLRRKYVDIVPALIGEWKIILFQDWTKLALWEILVLPIS